jgi:hypothetical protein
MPLPYVATPDASSEPKYLGTQDGSFEYAPGARRSPASVFEQTARGLPVFWQNEVTTRFPYAVVGDNGWRDYTVSASVRFTAKGQSAGLISRFAHPKANGVAQKFHGYQFIVSSSGAWRLLLNNVHQPARVLASGHLAKPPGPGTWFRLALSEEGPNVPVDAATLRQSGGHRPHDVSMPIGRRISTSGWYPVQFRELTVTRAPR